MTDLPPHDWHADIIAGIVAAYQRSRKAVYIEIGVDQGHTLNKVASYTSQAHGVDKSWEAYKAWEWQLKENITRWTMDSDSFFDNWRAGEFNKADVIFIDGDHHVEQVSTDFHNAATILAEDGTIILHDTFPTEPEHWHYTEDAYKMADLLSFTSWKTWTLPLFPGLTVVSRNIDPCRMRRPPVDK